MWVYSALLLVCVSISVAQPIRDVPYCKCGFGFCYNATLDNQLDLSRDMSTQRSSITVAVPFDILSAYIDRSDWQAWNPLFSTVQTTQFDLCGPLDAYYSNGQFLGPVLPKNLAGPHNIIQKGYNSNESKYAYGWWFTLLLVPTGDVIVYGRHTYTLTDAGNGFTLVESYEKAAGINVAENSLAWTIALEESLVQGIVGAVCLERVYKITKELDPVTVSNSCTKFSP